MALKDWKKYFEGKDSITWQKIHRNDEREELAITKFKTDGRWLVYHKDVGFSPNLLISFNTKSAALAYAKNFMRSH